MYSLYFADGDDINVWLPQLQPVEKVDETVEDVLAVNEPGGVLVDAERRSRLHVAQKVRLEIFESLLSTGRPGHLNNSKENRVKRKLSIKHNIAAKSIHWKQPSARPHKFPFWDSNMTIGMVHTPGYWPVVQGGKMQSCYFKLLKHYYNTFNLLYILK